MYIYMCVCVCVYIYMHIYIYSRDAAPDPPGPPGLTKLSLYTILLCTILYGVWHKNGVRRGAQILRNRTEMVLPPCGQCRWRGAIKG